jgi:hypothetical protein
MKGGVFLDGIIAPTGDLNSWSRKTAQDGLTTGVLLESRTFDWDGVEWELINEVLSMFVSRSAPLSR